MVRKMRSIQINCFPPVQTFTSTPICPPQNSSKYPVCKYTPLENGECGRKDSYGPVGMSGHPSPQSTDSNCHFSRGGCSCYCPPSMMRTTPFVCTTLSALTSKMLSRAENCLNPEILSLRSNEILILSFSTRRQEPSPEDQLTGIHSPRPSLQLHRKNLDCDVPPPPFHPFNRALASTTTPCKSSAKPSAAADEAGGRCRER